MRWRCIRHDWYPSYVNEEVEATLERDGRLLVTKWLTKKPTVIIERFINPDSDTWTWIPVDVEVYINL